MNLTHFAFVTLSVTLFATACGGFEEDVGSAQLADGSSNLEQLKSTFRNATSKYKKSSKLAADGWVQLQPSCFEEDEGTVQLGIVFVRPAIIDAVIDQNHPEVLYFEPQADGSLELMGGEYFCPIDACPTPPSLFGQTFRFEEDTQGHALHVWAWLENPNGLTAASNPNVDTTYCP